MVFFTPPPPLHTRYGIGHVYLRQEKHELAEYHFKRAADIHPASSVLHCYAGIAAARGGRSAAAEAALRAAVAADPRNPLARFELASLLAARGDAAAGLAELQPLTRLAPREPAVWAATARLLRKLGRPADALAALNTALDLNPPAADAAAIRGALDRLSGGRGGRGESSEDEV